ncbi:hypothetical protein XpopCFBP1817_19795 [Xanthomonas populi]|uniref:Uncharacterized protein n=1 Tax=Xanthomonas populi TaxID=53414 RepID=A0A2S7E6V8_9XANT|nr:hypothetical protein XpopCFBP1817_19795 [Xanthomonas populi]
MDSTLLLTEVAYVTPYKLSGGAVGINTLLPLINLDASFGRIRIATLRDNGADVGDLTFVPYLQMLQVIRSGCPVFSQRSEIDAIALIGKFDRDLNLNQSAGYWSLVPQYAFTVFPTPNWEASARINYIYKLRTQFRDNPTNGQRVADTRQSVFYAGPDGVWRMYASNMLFANVSLPVDVKNAASGNNVNLQYVDVV